MRRMRVNSGGNAALLVAFLLFVSYLLIYIVQQQDAIITIHDNLDSEVIYRVLLKSTNNLFAIGNDVVINPVMNGIKRNCFNVSSFNVITLLYAFLPPFTAYLVNFALVKAIAFAGMYLLLSKYLVRLEVDQKKFIAGFLALSFALLPFYTMYGITIAGLPLFTFCILNILNRKHLLLSYLVVFLFPFYSSLILGGYAILFVTGLAFLYYLYKSDKTKYLPLFYVLSGTTVLYLVAEINQLNLLLFAGDFTSHRTGWDMSYSHYNLLKVVKKTAEQFLIGHYHAASLHTVILIFVPAVLYLLRKKLTETKLLLAVLLALCLISLLYGVYNWEILIPLKNSVKILKTFQFHRFNFLSPFLWYILFALCINEVANRSTLKWHKRIVVAVVMLNFVYVAVLNTELRQNIIQIFTPDKSNISYKEYFAEDLMYQVREAINKPQSTYRIVSVGIPPAVAQYNGFYTLDSYQNNYPLAYKVKFRQIIAPELEKSQELKQYFDSWGNRCYVFSSEIADKNYFVLNGTSIENLDLDTKALKGMGGDYILSALEIKNSNENNLAFVGKFSSPETPLKVYLYEVNHGAATALHL